MSSTRLTKIGLGREATALTSTSAATVWPGEGEWSFDDKIATPTYMTGEAGYTVENTFVGDTGTTLTLKDTYASPEMLAWLLTGAISSSTLSGCLFTFSFPTTASNAASPATFTWEFGMQQQEYEAGGCYVESFNLHGDVGANDGLVMLNAVVKGKASASSTATASASVITNHFGGTLTCQAGQVRLDALGTAAGTAASIGGWLRAFSLDVKTGWYGGRYFGAAANRDYSVVEGGGTEYEISGTLKCLMNSQAVTEIANSRAGTGRAMQIQLPGAASRYVYLNIPYSYSQGPKVGGESENGLLYVTFNFKGGYSRTATAQGPQIICRTASAFAIT